MKLVQKFIRFVNVSLLVLIVLFFAVCIYCNASPATTLPTDPNRYLTPETLVLSFLGFLIRWFFHLVRAQSKLKDQFTLTAYVYKNAYTVILSFLCTIALFILVPFFLVFMDWFHYWKPISFFCGTSNIEVIEILKNKFVKTVERKAGSEPDSQNQ